MSEKKTKRNEEIVKKRKEGWTFREIAKHYRIDVKTAFSIWKRFRGAS